MKICICGGGNLGHVVAGFIAAQGVHHVCILTRRPERWGKELLVETPSGTILKGPLDAVCKHPEQALADADIVFLCLPGFSIREVLLQIKDHLEPNTAVGSVVSSTGFFFEAMKVLPLSNPLFGFQRVPFIARVLEYGHRARLMGYKEHLSVAVEHSGNPETLRQTLEQLLNTPVSLLRNFYEASLSNSNPLLHPARLYDLWSDWHRGDTYEDVPFFYQDWTENAARLYLAMDNELQQLLTTLPITPGSIPTVLDYYESRDVPSLASKLRSIPAFQGIRAPMKAVEGGYVPDFQSRYFTEDFPYGLSIVRNLAHEKNVNVPTIDEVCRWGMNQLAL